MPRRGGSERKTHPKKRDHVLQKNGEGGEERTQLGKRIEKWGKRFLKTKNADTKRARRIDEKTQKRTDPSWENRGEGERRRFPEQ